MTFYFAPAKITITMGDKEKISSSASFELWYRASSDTSNAVDLRFLAAKILCQKDLPVRILEEDQTISISAPPNSWAILEQTINFPEFGAISKALDPNIDLPEGQTAKDWLGLDQTVWNEGIRKRLEALYWENKAGINEIDSDEKKEALWGGIITLGFLKNPAIFWEAFAEYRQLNKMAEENLDKANNLLAGQPSLRREEFKMLLEIALEKRYSEDFKLNPLLK